MSFPDGGGWCAGWTTGDDFGGIAIHVMSSASRHHTGDTFIIDGGYALY